MRNDIINAAREYQKMANKKYLYVYGDKFFEVIYKTSSFKHLTGVGSYLSAKNFYKKAVKGILADSQIHFNSRYPYTRAKKKLSCLKNIFLLVSSIICVVEDLNTVSVTYKIGLTNLNFTIGFMKEDEKDNYYSPQTLRVKDKSIENSQNAEFIDFIFEKEATEELYEKVTYKEEGKELPKKFLGMLSDDLKEKFSPKLLV